MITHGVTNIKDEYMILKKGNIADISFTAMLNKRCSCD